MNKELKKMKNTLTLASIFLIIAIFVLPLSNLWLYGKFTYNVVGAIEYGNNQRLQEMDCEFGAIQYGGGIGSRVECQLAPCKTYNIEGYECVREGYTGNGLLGMTDWDTEYYVCKDLGRVALSCIDYFDSEEELLNYYNTTHNTEKDSK